MTGKIPGPFLFLVDLVIKISLCMEYLPEEQLLRLNETRQNLLTALPSSQPSSTPSQNPVYNPHTSQPHSTSPTPSHQPQKSPTYLPPTVTFPRLIPYSLFRPKLVHIPHASTDSTRGTNSSHLEPSVHTVPDLGHKSCGRSRGRQPICL